MLISPEVAGKQLTAVAKLVIPLLGLSRREQLWSSSCTAAVPSTDRWHCISLVREAVPSWDREIRTLVRLLPAMCDCRNPFQRIFPKSIQGTGGGRSKIRSQVSVSPHVLAEAHTQILLDGQEVATGRRPPGRSRRWRLTVVEACKSTTRNEMSSTCAQDLAKDGSAEDFAMKSHKGNQGQLG